MSDPTGPPVTDIEWTVSPPAGWEPVADICLDLFAVRDQITEALVSEITEQVEHFAQMADQDGVEAISWVVQEGITTFIQGVAKCSPPEPQDLEFQRTVGHLAAIEGTPLEPLITAYQIGFRSLWTMLATRSTGGAAAGPLLEHGSIVWERLVAITSAVSDGYHRETAARETVLSAAATRFVDALHDDPPGLAAAEPAKALGFDPDGWFQIMLLAGPELGPERARAVADRIQVHGVRARSAPCDHGAVLVIQGAPQRLMDGQLRDELPTGGAIAIGGIGEGLVGAQQSLAGAEQALDVAVARRGICDFPAEWLLATVYSQWRATEPVLNTGVAIANEKPHLAEAAIAFGNSGFSIARSARLLQLSPNSVRYRLTTWRELTGWDPWTFNGLALTLLAAGWAEAGDSHREQLHRLA